MLKQYFIAACRIFFILRHTIRESRVEQLLRLLLRFEHYFVVLTFNIHTLYNIRKRNLPI